MGTPQANKKEREGERLTPSRYGDGDQAGVLLVRKDAHRVLCALPRHLFFQKKILKKRIKSTKKSDPAKRLLTHSGNGIRRIRDNVRSDALGGELVPHVLGKAHPARQHPPEDRKQIQNNTQRKKHLSRAEESGLLAASIMM